MNALLALSSKKYYVGIVALIATLVAVFFFSTNSIKAFASHDTLTLTNAVVTIGGYQLTLNGQVESVTAREQDFDVVLSSGSALTVTSLNKKTFAINVTGNSTHTQTCNQND